MTTREQMMTQVKPRYDPAGGVLCILRSCREPLSFCDMLDKLTLTGTSEHTTITQHRDVFFFPPWSEQFAVNTDSVVYDAS